MVNVIYNCRLFFNSNLNQMEFSYQRHFIWTCINQKLNQKSMKTKRNEIRIHFDDVERIFSEHEMYWEWFWLFWTFSSIQLLKRRICHLWIYRFSFIFWRDFVFAIVCVDDYYHDSHLLIHTVLFDSLSIVSIGMAIDFCLIRKWIECKSVVVKFFLLI